MLWSCLNKLDVLTAHPHRGARAFLLFNSLNSKSTYANSRNGNFIVSIEYTMLSIVFTIKGI